MKKQIVNSTVSILSMLLFISLFNACDLIEEDSILPTNEVGTVLWVYDDFNVFPQEVDPVSITAPAIGPDGTIYVGSCDRMGSEWQNGRVHAINPDSTFKWASPELDGPTIYEPVVGSDGTIYVICNTTVYALSPADGSYIWTYQPPADSNEQHEIAWLTLGNDGQIFFAHIESGAYARRIYALNNNGQLGWKRKVGWGATNLTVGIDGTLYAYWLENGDIKTYGALNPYNGMTIWSKEIEGHPRGTAVSPDGDLILSQYSPDQLIKIDASTGEYIWTTDALPGYPTVSSDGSIYVIDGDLYCYNTYGSLKWQSGPYYGNMGKSALDAAGNCYGSFTDHGEGNFQVCKPDGSPKWAIYQDITGTHCPAIGPNNVIYVTVSSVPKATIYAIQGDSPLSSSGWSRDTGGNGNSRNINQQ